MDDGQDVSEEDLGSYMDVIANLCEQRDAVRPDISRFNKPGS